MQGDIVSGVLLPLILAFIMFSLGLGLTVGDFRRIFAQPRALLVGVVCHFVLLPLACFLLLSAWGMTGVFAVGFMILAACPTGSTSNLLTYLARGDVALALSFTAVASVATIFTLPLVVTWALGHYLGAARAVDVPVGLMMGQVAMVLGLPVSAGMWVRHRWSAWAQRFEPRATRVARCCSCSSWCWPWPKTGRSCATTSAPWRRLRCCSTSACCAWALAWRGPRACRAASRSPWALKPPCRTPPWRW